ncbi:hypothetical protein [Kineothrix sp. MB12-C1]|uniref:hypothetical protein n=1 Tax=Kineothrix sp. MB12-C1 TaxID=3070215 RepID=UPI0027D32D7F|nr:hypothetical protein [Kineothrix sp. MB12-C1]WMC93961.1 hypothetical protein RBB56_06790 [Kineothrix sp. MB12-C1]
MDNFMDKIAQKLSSQEVIRANSAADAAQIERLQLQVAEYNACMQEMRKLNLKNVESEQRLQELFQSIGVQIDNLFSESNQGIEKLTEECIMKIQSAKGEEEKKIEIETKLEELFKQADDFVHKENVKVYRNVQAVLVEEIEKQTRALMGFGAEALASVNTINEANRKKSKGIFALAVTTLIISLANMGLLIAHVMGVF